MLLLLFLIPVAAAGIGLAVKEAVDSAQLARAVERNRDEFCENIRRQRITFAPRVSP